MNNSSFRSLIWLAAAGMLLNGIPVHAAQPRGLDTSDVVLDGNGLLVGTVMNSAAQPLSQAKVEILNGQDVVATTHTTSEGHFAVKGLRSGSHIIRCSDSQKVVRFWNTSAAPPNAISRVAVIVDQQPVVRAQANGMSGYMVPFGIGAAALAGTLWATLGQDDKSAVIIPVSP